MNNKSGLTFSMVFEAESANYGEGFGNISTLKKMTRANGEAYSYLSRQALRYNMVQQLGWDEADSLHKEGKDVIQFDPKATIDRYKEIDLFGYMKTTKGSGSATRSAVVRLSHAVALEPLHADTDFLTNMGFAKRIQQDNSIAMSEIHHSLYAYTVTVDLDRIGVDGDIEIPKKERAQRVKDFLNIVKTLYRDIKGRRENLAPVFAIGGTYERKNPFFENRITLKKGQQLDVAKITDTMEIDSTVKANTAVGYVRGTFANEQEVTEKLKPVGIGEFFDRLCREVDEYYA